MALKQIAEIFLAVGLAAQFADAQSVSTFAGNAQHTAIYQPAARDLNRIRWTTPIDLDNAGFAHYGAPLITAANTVIVPVKTSSGFQISAFDGNGAAKYTLPTDYILPAHSWIPVYQPALAPGPTGVRLYYPGAGGTVYRIDNPDASSPGAATQIVFYTTLAGYQVNANDYDSTVFINTPITADANGNIFFGFRVQGSAPAPLSTDQSGFARIDPAGNATYVLAGAAASDAAIRFDSHNSAPALSLDESTVYVAVKSATTEYYGYLLGLDAVTLATKYKVFLKDPRNGNNAGILDVSTASATVAPDGDIYFGIMGNPGNGARGFLLRFSGDLNVEKIPGGFGWDYTAAIVPASMAPLYTGASSYLIFAKYNNYAFADGDGVNRIALLDPNATQIDPHTSANGLIEMREVLTVIGPTSDEEHPALPLAVREWCINTAAINPATNSIFVPNEDGHIYRWNLTTNSLSQALTLGAGIGQPYVPTVIGPDGTIYTLNGGTLFALGEVDNVRVTLASSVPDLRTLVAGQTVLLSASVSNSGSSGLIPTGTVTFQDMVYFLSGSGELDSTTTTLAIVTIDGNGNAAWTTGGLSAAEHFFTAAYSGDANFSPASMTRVQKAHAFGSTTDLSSSPNPSGLGQAVTFTATVTPVPPGLTVPTGMVTFLEGANVLAQVPLSAEGTASYTRSWPDVGNHTIAAFYVSDIFYASSSGSRIHVVQDASTTTSLSSSANPAVFGQTVTFTALVNVAAGTPTGAVTFMEGATAMGTGVLDATGHATFTTSDLAVGSHAITAMYSGDSFFSGSVSAPISETVNRATTRMTLTSSLDPAKVRQPVTFTATVSVNAPGTGTPSGTVRFLDKGKLIGSVVLDATGTAVFTTKGLALGAHQIRASYDGNASFVSSASPTIKQNIKK